MECNVSAISYHFGSKEELYKACLCEGGYNIVQIMESVLTNPENASDFKAKLRLFQIQFFEYAINNRDLFVMISKDINSKLGMETIHKIFHKVPETMTAFFQKAIDNGILKKDVDPAVLGDLVTQPLFMHILFAEANKQMKNKNVGDSKYRQHFIDQQLQILLEPIFK